MDEISKRTIWIWSFGSDGWRVGWGHGCRIVRFRWLDWKSAFGGQSDCSFVFTARQGDDFVCVHGLVWGGEQGGLAVWAVVAGIV